MGRYAVFDPIARGGMATVHLGRLQGAGGFSRTVAIKRLHPELARLPEFVAAFAFEARLAARIHHPHVVDVVDVLPEEGGLLLVMDYVHGESLAALWRAARERGSAIAPRIAVAALVGALHGLHAAHEALDEHGEPLGVVHRDVSPQNILIGADGIARVLDFGIAKASGRLPSTRTGQIKGKIEYLAPEQLVLDEVGRQTDVYSAAVVLWELLAGRRLFQKESSGGIVYSILEAAIDPPSRWAPEVTQSLDAVVMRGLERNKRRRYATARDFALALEAAVSPAPAPEVAAWVADLAGDTLERRARDIAAMVRSSERRASAAPASRSAKWRIAPLLLAVVVALVAVSLFQRRAGAPLAIASAPSTSASSAVDAPVARVEPRASEAAAVSSSAGPAPDAVVPPAPKVALRAGKRASVKPRDPAPAASSSGAARVVVDCDPPYTQDSSGIRYPKPECL